MALTKVTGAMITDGAVTSAKLTDGAVTSAKLAADAATDQTSVHQGIATLGLHMGVADNKVAFNLPNSFIDVFQDSSGVTTTTGVSVNASEYVSSVTAGGTAIDSYDKLILHSNTTNGSTTFTDSSSSAHGLTAVGNAQHTTASLHSGFGTSSIIVDGTGDWVISNSTSADWSFGTGDFTIDFWARTNVTGAHGTFVHNRNATSGAANRWWIGQSAGKIGLNTNTAIITGSTTMSTGTWYHVAFVRSSGTLSCYLNGVSDATAITSYTVDFSPVDKLTIGGSDPAGALAYNGQIDEMRISKGIARWTSGFTPETSAYGSTTTGATGTLISDAQTATESTTEVSGAFLYTDNAGTNTIGTDLKIYFTANNGGAWTEAASYGTAQVFSGSIKQVKLGKTTVTAGTQIAIKAVWANQVASTKVAHLEGWAVNY